MIHQIGNYQCNVSDMLNVSISKDNKTFSTIDYAKIRNADYPRQKLNSFTQASIALELAITAYLKKLDKKTKTI